MTGVETAAPASRSRFTPEQDLYLSAGFVRLLRAPAGTSRRSRSCLPTTSCDPAGLLATSTESSGWGLLLPASAAGAVGCLILRFRRRARALDFGPGDVLIAFSFREFALNVLIRALRRGPPDRCSAKADAETEQLLTRRRPLLSLYWNAWNRALGVTTQRYRWLRLGPHRLRNASP